MLETSPNPIYNNLLSIYQQHTYKRSSWTQMKKKKGRKERKILQRLLCEYCSYFVEHNLLPPNIDAPWGRVHWEEWIGKGQGQSKDKTRAAIVDPTHLEEEEEEEEEEVVVVAIQLSLPLFSTSKLMQVYSNHQDNPTPKSQTK